MKKLVLTLIVFTGTVGCQSRTNNSAAKSEEHDEDQLISDEMEYGPGEGSGLQARIFDKKGNDLGSVDVSLPSNDVRKIDSFAIEFADKTIKFIPSKDISTNPVSKERTGQTYYYLDDALMPTIVVGLSFDVLNKKVTSIEIIDYSKVAE